MSSLTLSSMWSMSNALGRKDFLVLPNRRYSYADLNSSVRAFCAVFDVHGLIAGDRLVICSKNEYCVASAFIAAVLHGLVPTNLAPTTKARRGTSVISDTDAKLLIADAPVIEEWNVAVPCEQVREARNRRRFGFSRGETWPLETTPGADTEPACPDDADALAYLLFTSGSTSDPSGVKLTLGNLLANLSSVGRVTDLRRDDRMFNDCPMPHTDGLIHGPLLAFAHGACVVRAGGFQLSRLEDWLNTIRREGCTQIITTPFIWSAICRYAEHDDYFAAPEMRLLISSAARLDPALWKDVEERFGKPLANEYGMTETVMAAFHAGPLDGMGATGSIGLPAHCEARLDETVSDQPDCGELLLRGPPISPGYWNNPERTRATRTEDGWFRTGDIARLRPDGSYDLVGRIKSIINSAGLRIHPDEINEALESHPSVSHAVTVGLPDTDFGEIAVTAVEVDGATTEMDLIAHARSLLEPLKVPKRVVIVDEIPRTDSGKPKLAETAAMLSGEVFGAQDAIETASGDIDHGKRVLVAAAQVFMCDSAELSLKSTQDDVAGWDSFSQLRLFLLVEEEFGIRLPTRRLTTMRTLGDLVEAIRDCA